VVGAWQTSKWPHDSQTCDTLSLDEVGSMCGRFCDSQTFLRLADFSAIRRHCERAESATRRLFCDTQKTSERYSDTQRLCMAVVLYTNILILCTPVTWTGRGSPGERCTSVHQGGVYRGDVAYGMRAPARRAPSTAAGMMFPAQPRKTE